MPPVLAAGPGACYQPRVGLQHGRPCSVMAGSTPLGRALRYHGSMRQAGAHIEFADVGLTYGHGSEALEALRSLTFEVRPGDSVALIGPSGCGKSTTLHLMAGLLAPTSGKVRVNGAPVGNPRQETSFIQQDLGLLPWKNTLQNAMLGLSIRKVPKGEALERARAALARVGLGDFERTYPKDLSGGMRQRLALARALAMDADLLLMDEPLSAIDALLRESLQDDLLALWRERAHTQVLVTHSIEEAVYLGRRVLVFSDRPATLVAAIDNPGMGSPGWRASAEYATKCQEIRDAMRSPARDAMRSPARDAMQPPARDAMQPPAELASSPGPSASSAGEREHEGGRECVGDCARAGDGVPAGEREGAEARAHDALARDRAGFSRSSERPLP